MAVPNPNPGSVAFLIQGNATRLRVRLYGSGLTCVGDQTQQGSFGPGWIRMQLDTQDLANGIYYFRAWIEGGSQGPSASIKGKLAVRARVTGNVGVYHLQGCRSYPGTTEPDRWFCTEEDAQAAGFRKAYNCRAKGK